MNQIRISDVTMKQVTKAFNGEKTISIDIEK